MGKYKKRFKRINIEFSKLGLLQSYKNNLIFMYRNLV